MGNYLHNGKNKPSAPSPMDQAIHHGGNFMDGVEVKHVGGGVSEIKLVDIDRLFKFEIIRLAKDIGFTNVEELCYLVPSMSLEEGLRTCHNDFKSLDMAATAVVHKRLVVYVIHRVDVANVVVLEMLPLPCPSRITQQSNMDPISSTKRTKHLIDILEDIRMTSMERIIVKRVIMRAPQDATYLGISSKLEKEKEEARNCFLVHSKTIFQVYDTYEGLITPCTRDRHWPKKDMPLELPPIKIGHGRPRRNRRKDSHEDPKKVDWQEIEGRWCATTTKVLVIIRRVVLNRHSLQIANHLHRKGNRADQGNKLSFSISQGRKKQELRKGEKQGGAWELLEVEEEVEAGRNMQEAAHSLLSSLYSEDSIFSVAFLGYQICTLK
ncbi:LOW QUALITY PROTEIN: hypothetical protein Cgig2_029743 [Carnegiea gigantea]|uniref:PB1-like domain-containing protein n=1 Tax=Carnegiea gigantea TaxID=171969 RepID=A0A9Q1QA86_9CARY|nr:LOW QUALITY PROTEIN: hypothetical protein Cgig2_029743 [Carnegiea gigantea]